jgi:hypothetical protein
LTTISSAALVVLIVAFAVAAVTKAASPATVRRAVRDLGAPRWSAAFLVPAEISIVALLILAPVAGSLAAAICLAVFTILLVRIVRSGRSVSCGCFGSRSVSAVTWTTVARNLGLLVLCLVATGSARLSEVPHGARVAVGLVATALVLGGLLVGVMLDVARDVGALFPAGRTDLA